MEKEEKQEIEKLFGKIMKENFPNLVKEIDIQVQEAQEVPNKMDTKRTTRHIIIKMPKVKDKKRTLAGVAQWIEYQPVNQRVTNSIPSQSTCLSCGAGLHWGVCVKQSHTDVSLPLFLPPFPPSLKINKFLKNLKKFIKK